MGNGYADGNMAACSNDCLCVVAQALTLVAVVVHATVSPCAVTQQGNRPVGHRCHYDNVCWPWPTSLRHQRLGLPNNYAMIVWVTSQSRTHVTNEDSRDDDCRTRENDHTWVQWNITTTIGVID